MTLSTSSEIKPPETRPPETRPSETRPPEARKDDPLLKLAFELGPLAVFFGVNAYVGKNGGIFTATAAFMVATLVALGVSYWRTRRLPIMPLVSGVVVLVFGTLTLVLHDELFIKLKPTIVNTLFGVVLLGGLVFGRSLLGIVFDAVFQLDERGWRILTFRWGLFFLALAVLNEVVWRNFSTDFWVTFKVFGIMPLTLVFAAAQVPLILRHSLEEEDGAAGTGASTGAGDGI